MPVGIKTPSNQIKLTNVSLVRMKKGAQIRQNLPLPRHQHLTLRT
jgi:hypothetical protein